MAWRGSVELIMLVIQRRGPCLAVFSGPLVSALLRAVFCIHVYVCECVCVSGFFCVWNPHILTSHLTWLTPALPLSCNTDIFPGRPIQVSRYMKVEHSYETYEAKMT